MYLSKNPRVPPHPTLHSLLTANLSLPPEYHEKLSNHLPMALSALHSLGGSPAQLGEFYANYVQRFEGLLVPVPAAPVPDWRVIRGQADAYPALYACFQHALARDGMDTVLRQSLPELLPGVAAAAFHGVIRTAHAVESGHLGELAAALAYWAWRWQPLTPPQGATTLLTFDPWAKQLVTDAAPWRSDRPSISARMDDASRSAVYQSLANSLQTATNLSDRLSELSTWAVDRYVASRNFTVMHMVTSLRALRTLLPWMLDKQAVESILVRAFTAAYLAANAEDLVIRPVQRANTWPEVITIAITSKDDHVIKIVHACREEAAVYGAGRHLEAAALAVS